MTQEGIDILKIIAVVSVSKSLVISNTWLDYGGWHRLLTFRTVTVSGNLAVSPDMINILQCKNLKPLNPKHIDQSYLTHVVTEMLFTGKLLYLEATLWE